MVLLITLVGCQSKSDLIKDAKNEAWSDLNELKQAFQQAEDAYFKDYYFIDMRSEAAYKATFVAGFTHVDRSEFQSFFKDVKKYAMIIIFSGNIETASEAASFLDALDFYNIKTVNTSETSLFAFFSDQLMSIDPDGNSCPIEEPQGC